MAGRQPYPALRVLVGLGFLGALGIACTGQPPRATVVAVPQAPEASSGPELSAESAPELQLVAEGFSYEGDPDPLRPCPVRGAVFLCGTSLAFVAGERRETGVRVPEDGVVGAWPDNLWTVVRTEQGGAISRWDPTRGAWAPVGEPLLDTPEDSHLRKIALHSWAERSVLVLDQGPLETDSSGAITSRLSLHVRATGRAPPAPSLRLPNGKAALALVTHSVAFASGEVVLLGWLDASAQTYVAQWSTDSPTATVHALDDGRCVPRQLVGISPSDLVVVGDGCALRFDGTNWRRLVLPPGAGEALSYARGPDNEEWVVMHHPEARPPPPLTLWSRRERGAWRRVEVPEASGLPDDPTPAERAGVVFVQDGAVWLWHSARHSDNRNTQALLTTVAREHDICVLRGYAGCAAKALEAAHPHAAPASP